MNKHETILISNILNIDVFRTKTDFQLCMYARSENKDLAQNALAELNLRYEDNILQSARYWAFKLQYDFNEIKRHGTDSYVNDAKSEAFIAAKRAFVTFDPSKGCSITTHLSNTIWSHYADLKRSNAKHSEREVNVNNNGKNNPDHQAATELLEADDRLHDEQEALHNADCCEARRLLVESLPAGTKVRTCMDLFIRAIDENTHNADATVAAAIGMSRQQVRNLLHKAAGMYSPTIRNATVDCLHEYPLSGYTRKASQTRQNW